MAFVGRSGALKSTMASLLCRLHYPHTGRILLDGQDLRSFDVASWRNHISLVTQDIFLFDDSVLKNIRFEFENVELEFKEEALNEIACPLYTPPSPRDQRGTRMPSSA